MKTCTKCGKEKALTEFCHSERNEDGLNYWCKDCTREHSRNYLKANKEKRARYNRAWGMANREKKREHFKRWYEKHRFRSVLVSSRKHAQKHDWVSCNATEEELETAFTGKCHACGVPELELNTKLHMDHCHKTGKFRGWLCMDCNHAIGKLKDSPERILALMKYVERVTVLTPNPQ